MMLATRNPVVGEFMRTFLRSRFALSVKIQHVTKEVGAIGSASF
jgi:hypothetical protein